MSKQDYTAENGPSWVDVKKCINHIEHEFNGKITITMELHHHKTNGEYMHVISEFRVLDEYPHGRVRTAKHTKWTAGLWRTVTALLYSQLLSIDNWLTNEKEEAEQRAMF